jgi:Fe2+ or Zn2+ uptake regulation protein
MPQVLSFFGLRVMIYASDHRPAHVHVIGRGCEAVFKLHCPHGEPELRENYGFKFSELSKIDTALTQHLTELCHHWRLIHGTY